MAYRLEDQWDLAVLGRPLTNSDFRPGTSVSQDCCIVYFTPAIENVPAYMCHRQTTGSGLSAVISVSLGRKGE
jgi:hypothetical protein